MISFRTGSHLHRLITLLSAAGEFPTQSLYLLGNEKEVKELVAKLKQPQTIRNSKTGESISFVKVVNVSGNGQRKTLRLYKNAVPILTWIDAEDYYMSSFRSHKFSGDEEHIERNHRVAETLAMFMGAGFEFRKNKLPILQNVEIRKKQFVRPCFYTSRCLKQIGITEANKTKFTRIVGAVLAGNDCYAVYNTRNAVMKWCGNGESKTQYGLDEVMRLNTEISRVGSAILFGASYKIAIATLEETARNQKLQLRFDAIYNCIHFIPLNKIGMRQLCLLAIPNWKEQLLDLLFEDEQRSYGLGTFDYDACVDGVYVLSHLDSDLGKLRRFKEAIEEAITKHRGTAEQYEVLCFEDQAAFLKKYLSGLAKIRVLKREDVEAVLNLKRRDIFEED